MIILLLANSNTETGHRQQAPDRLGVNSNSPERQVPMGGQFPCRLFTVAVFEVPNKQFFEVENILLFFFLLLQIASVF